MVHLDNAFIVLLLDVSCRMQFTFGVNIVVVVVFIIIFGKCILSVSVSNSSDYMQLGDATQFNVCCTQSSHTENVWSSNKCTSIEV